MKFENLKMSYFLIVDLVQNADEIIYTLRDLLNDETHIITEDVENNRVSNWLNRILLDNGIKFPNPTYTFIAKRHTGELFFHAFINENPQTINDVKLVSMDNAKIFLEYEKLRIERLKLNELEQIDKKLGV